MVGKFYFLVFICAYGHTKTISHDDSQEVPLILTPYIERGETETAKNLSAVDPSYFAGVNSYSAYFTVNKTNKWHLFFWYFPAEGVKLENTPLIIWLQGGPGSSSLFGLFTEIGPIQYVNGKVERMPITWGSNYSLLFIDNPVGTGFSFTENENKYATDEDMVGACLLSFIQQFLQVFPELRTAPLFIAGESYAGKYIPAFGHYIHHNNNDSMPINLKGLAIGDGWTDPPTLLHYSEFELQVGLLDPEEANELHNLEEEARQAWKDGDIDQFEELAYHISDKALNSFVVPSCYNYLADSDPLFRSPSEEFLNKPDIQKALHVKETFQNENDNVSQNLQNDRYKTVKPWLEELLEHYGVMCYNGQLDVIVAYALSLHTYRSLKWSGQQAYLDATRYSLYDDTGCVTSYVKGSGNFMDVMVRKAGHMVPTDQPKAAKQIIDMFIQKFK